MPDNIHKEKFSKLFKKIEYLETKLKENNIKFNYKDLVLSAMF